MKVCPLFVLHPPIYEHIQTLSQTQCAWESMWALWPISRGFCYPPATSQQISLSMHQQRGRTAQLSRKAEVKAEQFPNSRRVAYHRLSAFQDNKTSASHTASLPQACLCIQIFGFPSPCWIKHSPEAKFFSKHLVAFDLRSSWCTAAPHYFCSSREPFAFSGPPLRTGTKSKNITRNHLSFLGKNFISVSRVQD